MRNKSDLFELEEISILLQYLYMSEEHSIIYFNGITNLQISMDENFNIWCKNLHFLDIKPALFNEQMTVPYILGIINTLKEDTNTIYDKFSNKWQEIKEITLSNISLNKL